MSQHQDQEITRDEIKKEFQLERMILFSDAVFAIVITLMAIEIKIPEAEPITEASLPKALLHLLPTLLAYVVSFGFIGMVWFQHLKMFSLLKDYDKGLVIRNMLLLFFVGMFPFTATLIARGNGLMLPFFIYLIMILCCIMAQYLLYSYIVQNQSIRLNTNISHHQEEVFKRKVSLLIFTLIAILIIITYLLIPDPNFKSFATFWMVLFPIIYRRYIKKRVSVVG